MKIPLLALTLLLSLPLAAAVGKPNIIYILADDLGYGDVGFLGGDRGKIPTPHIDRLASKGITLTEAHSSLPSPRNRGSGLPKTRSALSSSTFHSTPRTPRWHPPRNGRARADSVTTATSSCKPIMPSARS